MTHDLDFNVTISFSVIFLENGTTYIATFTMTECLELEVVCDLGIEQNSNRTNQTRTHILVLVLVVVVDVSRSL